MTRAQAIKLLHDEKAEACLTGDARTVGIDEMTIALITVSETRDREAEALSDHAEVYTTVAFVHLTPAGELLVGRRWGLA